MLLALAMACPVCFGANDSPMAQATNTGIIFMLVVVAAVLVGFASFFISLIRRARAAAAAERALERPGFVSQEGTA